MLSPAIAVAIGRIISFVFQMNMVLLTRKTHVKHKSDAIMRISSRKRSVSYGKLNMQDEEYCYERRGDAWFRLEEQKKMVGENLLPNYR